MNLKKQQKITKLFRKGAVAKTPAPEPDELQEEIRELEQQLKDKQNELFDLQRNSYRHKVSPIKTKRETFVRPQTIVLNNSIWTLKRDLELMSMLTGMEIQSYVADDHCCIVFHLQHDAEHEVKHGLRIDTKAGVNKVSGCSLPLGFNLTAVLDDFENMMKPESLIAIRKALVAYYDRLDQFQMLKKLLNVEAELFKIMDGTHIMITFYVQAAADEEDDEFSVVLMLDYRVYDIRPKTFSIKENDLPEEAAEIIKEQCAIFKKKPLDKAFTEAFMDDLVQYKMVKQVGTRPVQERRRRKRPRPNPHRGNDDTFHPEDCSDPSEDDCYV